MLVAHGGSNLLAGVQGSAVEAEMLIPVWFVDYVRRELLVGAFGADRHRVGLQVTVHEELECDWTFADVGRDDSDAMFVRLYVAVVVEPDSHERDFQVKAYERSEALAVLATENDTSHCWGLPASVVKFQQVMTGLGEGVEELELLHHLPAEEPGGRTEQNDQNCEYDDESCHFPILSKEDSTQFPNDIYYHKKRPLSRYINPKKKPTV